MIAATFLCVYSVILLFTNGPSKSYMFLLNLDFIRLFWRDGLAGLGVLTLARGKQHRLFDHSLLNLVYAWVRASFVFNCQGLSRSRALKVAEKLLNRLRCAAFWCFLFEGYYGRNAGGNSPNRRSTCCESKSQDVWYIFLEQCFFGWQKFFLNQSHSSCNGRLGAVSQRRVGERYIGSSGFANLKNGGLEKLRVPFWGWQIFRGRSVKLLGR